VTAQASTKLRRPAGAADDELLRHLAGFVRFILQTCGRDVLQTIDEHQLSLSQLKALQILGEQVEDVSLKGLGDHLGLSLPAISRAVDGLVQRGLVSRTEDTADRRIKRVRVTAGGRALVDALTALRMRELGQFVATLAPRDRARLSAALAPLAQRDEIAAMIPRQRAGGRRRNA
jgi:DNA-binding MarR family transcriptional regulator